VVSIAAVGRFFRTPKGLLTIILAVFVAIAAPHEGLTRVVPLVGAAVLAAALIDLPILRLIRHRVAGSKWEFPSGAILSGLFVAMVLSSREPWYVAAATAAIAVISKYVMRTRAGNIFNPAALAIVAAYYLFDSAQSWWGALPEVHPAALLLLVAAGVFITDRVNRMPLALTFLGSYFVLFTAAAYVGEPRLVAEIFRAPDLQAVLFFAFFFLTDPPTSPVPYSGQVICGALVAAASFVIFERTGAVHYLLAGVLVGNVYEAWRRGRPLTLRHFAAAATPTRAATG
jgi:Na+-translocating ferredoxin:NAD+ oxidoreductase RnfD subunit